MSTSANRYGYPYFHRNCAEYGRLRSEIARKRAVFIRNIGGGGDGDVNDAGCVEGDG